MYDSRQEKWTLHLSLEQKAEERLRSVILLSRDRYISNLTQRRAQLIRECLVWGSQGSEVATRIEIEDMQLQTLKVIWDDYLFRTARLIGADIGATEHKRRKGYGGIEYQERREWEQIVRCVIGLKLQLLQGDDFTDVQCETGSRKAIEWAEGRSRWALQTGIAASAVTVLLPGEEETGRARILNAEFKERARLKAQPIALEVTERVNEPTARRAIFAAYCAETATILFTWAQVRVQLKEETHRLRYYRLFSSELQHLASMEYLHFVEMKDRHMLRGLRDRATKRIQATQHMIGRLVFDG